ncbi:MAG: hypothetical protein RL701_685, partial [Pseudomonadota bacterium]
TLQRFEFADQAALFDVERDHGFEVKRELLVEDGLPNNIRLLSNDFDIEHNLAPELTTARLSSHHPNNRLLGRACRRFG